MSLEEVGNEYCNSSYGNAFDCPCDNGQVLWEACNFEGSGGGGGGDPNNSYVSTITNNITEPCLNEVYNKITESVYKNKLSQMLQDFQNSTQIQISINTDNTLASNVYGKAYGTTDNNYNIDLNAAILKQCSQEFIASIYFHEVIHVWLKQNIDTWITQSNSEHTVMLENYFNHLVESVREVFPTLPEKDAYCMILDCIQNSDNDPAFDQAVFDALKAAYLYMIQFKYPDLSSESEITAIADLYREGGLQGTRSSNCN